MAILRARYHYRLGRFPRSLTEGAEAAAAAADIRMELIAAERDYIYRMLQEGQITDEARRRLERELDLEEASIALNREEGLGPPL
jgi:CPA1 family monovalent cation:H+ antiporter